MYLAGSPRIRAADDWFVLDEMKACMRRHLGAALIECAALSRELTTLDGDCVMAALRAQFDPYLAGTSVKDCFSDGFRSGLAVLKDSGDEPLAVRAELPSGAADER